MTEGLAIELAKQKMLEMGVGENYLIRFRHFQLAPLSQIKIQGFNELLILVRPDDNVKVYSKAGIYNEQDNGINEMQYVGFAEKLLKSLFLLGFFTCFRGLN